MAWLLYNLGLNSARRPLRVVASWLALLAVAVGSMGLFGGTLTTAMSIEGLESQTVVDQLKESFPEASRGTGSLVFQTAEGSAFTAAQKAALSKALNELTSLPGVADVVSPFETAEQIAAKREEAEGASAKLDAAEAKLDAAEAKLKSAPAQIAAAKAKLATAQTKIDGGRVQLAAARPELESGLTKLTAAIAAAEAQSAPEATLAPLRAQRLQLEAGLAKLDAQSAALDAGQAKIDAGLAEIAIQEAQLAPGQAKIDSGRAEIASAREQLEYANRLLAITKEFRVVSSDETTALATVVFDQPLAQIEDDVFMAVTSSIQNADLDGVNVEYSKELSPLLTNILGVGEIIGVIVAGIVLFIMLGTFVGAGLPLLAAVTGVGIAAAATQALSSLVEMTTTTPVLGVMLGLAVGIDYTLFILNRHRRQLKAGVELHESIGLATGTSGTAVLFAGLTVVIALAALNLTGIGFLALMGTVGAFAIVLAVLAAVTLTPALLSLADRRVLSRRELAKFDAERDHSESSMPKNAWQPVLPTRHPWLTILFATATVLLLSIPAPNMRLGLPDGLSEPADSSQYRAYTITSDAFGEGANGPVLAVVTMPEKLDDVQQIATQADIGERLFALDNVTAVVPAAVSKDGTRLMFQVLPATGPNSDETATLVGEIRALAPQLAADLDAEIGVTGLAAMNIDISEKIGSVLPRYLGTVILLSLLLLIVVFRSIPVPMLATAGFLATVMATFGAIVAVFQYGWVGAVFGVHDPGPVLSFLPIMLIGVLFGLAMDYQLFITSGIREAHIHGKSPLDSINYGVHLSRSVVVAAATIMIFVFGGFAFSHMAMVRPIGFGLAFGVLVDAFVVRLLIFPAVMKILGERMWWLPRWLDRVLPNVDIEGAALEREHLH